MREGDRFEVLCEGDGMVADDVPAAEHVHPYLVLPFGDPFPAVDLLTLPNGLVQDREDRLRRSARCVLLVEPR